MNTTTYQTNLNCQNCLAKVRPILDAEPRIHQWSVDTSVPSKALTITSDGLSSQTVKNLVESAGFRVLSEIGSTVPAQPETTSKWVTYYPLLLVIAFVAGVATIVDLRDGNFDWAIAMNWFMSGFFLVFAFFKLLDVPAFVMAFQSYDVVARKIPAYGYAYPFIELLLGLAYLTGMFPAMANVVTLVVMGVGLVGVTQAVLSRRTIQCACLGTVFKLPMSSVTVVENGLMAAMAVAMIATHVGR